MGPKLILLLCIQEPAIVERRGGRPTSSITGSAIANRVNRSTRRKHFDFRDAGANKSNARDILT